MQASSTSSASSAIVNSAAIVEFCGDIVALDEKTTLKRVSKEMHCYESETVVLKDLKIPTHMAKDSKGNVFCCDMKNHRVVVFDPRKGRVEAFAGTGEKGYKDGKSQEAQFYRPYGITVTSRDEIIVSEIGSHRIRRIANGVVSTIAGSGHTALTDGVGTAASFDMPRAMACDSKDTIYVCDEGNSVIRRIATDGTVTTLAGSERGKRDGRGTEAAFDHPCGLAITSANLLIVADSQNNQIRSVTLDGVVSTVAGTGQRGCRDGRNSIAMFSKPESVAVDASGNIYVADTDNQCIRKVTKSCVATIAGSIEAGLKDGRGDVARFDHPVGLLLFAKDRLFVSDSENNRICSIRLHESEMNKVLLENRVTDIQERITDTEEEMKQLAKRKEALEGQLLMAQQALAQWQSAVAGTAVSMQV